MTSQPGEIAAVRRAIESLCGGAGFDDSEACDVGLCVNEALANVIRHAYGGAAGKPIAISAQFDGDAIEIRIRDWGNGVNPALLPERPHDPLIPGGLGLICLRRFLNEVRFETQPDGMLLIMRKRKNRPDSDQAGSSSPRPVRERL